MEQIGDGQDGLVVLDCHEATAVNLTSDFPIPLGKSACNFGGILTARFIYINLLALTTQAKRGKIIFICPI